MDEIIHANFVSSQGAKIDVAYFLRYVPGQGEDLYCAHITIMVEGARPTMTPESKIRAVLINHYRAFRNGISTYQKVWTIDLKPKWLSFDDTMFAGNPPAPIEIAHFWRDGHRILSERPQVAVRIDDAWQHDPWQAPGIHNFNFKWRSIT